MSQPSLFRTSPRFDGATYEPAQDDRRLHPQMGRVWAVIQDGQWRTVREIARITGDPETSVSCHLRNFRKARWGSHRIDRRSRGERSNGLYEYRLAGV